MTADQRAKKVLDKLMWPDDVDTLSSFTNRHLRNTAILARAFEAHADERAPRLTKRMTNDEA